MSLGSASARAAAILRSSLCLLPVDGQGRPRLVVRGVGFDGVRPGIRLDREGLPSVDWSLEGGETGEASLTVWWGDLRLGVLRVRGGERGFSDEEVATENVIVRMGGAIRLATLASVWRTMPAQEEEAYELLGDSVVEWPLERLRDWLYQCGGQVDGQDFDWVSEMVSEVVCGIDPTGVLDVDTAVLEHLSWLGPVEAQVLAGISLAVFEGADLPGPTLHQVALTERRARIVSQDAWVVFARVGWPGDPPWEPGPEPRVGDPGPLLTLLRRLAPDQYDQCSVIIDGQGVSGGWAWALVQPDCSWDPGPSRQPVG